jgi:hypothetical protein
LPALLDLAGIRRRPDAAEVRRATGFAMGGVAPVGLPGPSPTAIDAPLGRFPVVYAAAPAIRAASSQDRQELLRLTPGVISPGLVGPRLLIGAHVTGLLRRSQKEAYLDGWVAERSKALAC